MASVRTQIYLTAEQRAGLDALMERQHKSLAQLIRDAVDQYLARARPDPEDALASTFGSIPDFAVPSRDEWDRV